MGEDYIPYDWGDDIDSPANDEYKRIYLDSNHDYDFNVNSKIQNVMQTSKHDTTQKPKHENYMADVKKIGNNIWLNAYPNLQKAIKQEGNITQEDLKSLARRGVFTPLLAPLSIAKDFAKFRFTKNMTDKYKHAYINCINTQRGLMNSMWTENLSGLKEYYDVKSGSNTPIESYEDMDANLTGNFLGIKYPDGDCDELVQRYFKKLW